MYTSLRKFIEKNWTANIYEKYNRKDIFKNIGFNFMVKIIFRMILIIWLE